MTNTNPIELGLIHFCDLGRVLFDTYADLVDDEDHTKGDPEMISAYGAWKAHKESCDKCGYS